MLNQQAKLNYPPQTIEDTKDIKLKTPNLRTKMGHKTKLKQRLMISDNLKREMWHIIKEFQLWCL